MIYIKIEGHDFKYQIEDVLRLFFKDEDIFYVDNEPPIDNRGIFILSSIIEETSQYKIKTELKLNGDHYTENLSVNTENIEGRELLKVLRREVKRSTYNILEGYTKRNSPWGMLTGIRPAKIVHELIDEGLVKSDIAKKLKEYYKVSEKKADLVYSVAESERVILENTKENMVGIYIGIPFCTTRCVYCSFTSNSITQYKKMLDSYINALKIEIDGVCNILKDKKLKVQSIYIGGGTPTSLDAIRLKELLDYIDKRFDMSSLLEYTLEAGRPDTIDEERLLAIKDSKVTRISINPQTMNDTTLSTIGRRHTASDVVEAFKIARNLGFDNINMDIIVGLPDEDISMFENTLNRIENLEPESLTVHTMSIKRASRLSSEIQKHNLASSEVASKMIDMAAECAESMAMKPYYLYRQKNILGNLENIGYSKPGFESVYNVQIMEEKQSIIAIGAGAVTKVVYPAENRIERAFNVKGVEEYISRVEEMIERKKTLFHN